VPGKGEGDSADDSDGRGRCGRAVPVPEMDRRFGASPAPVDSSPAARGQRRRRRAVIAGRCAATLASLATAPAMRAGTAADGLSHHPRHGRGSGAIAASDGAGDGGSRVALADPTFHVKAGMRPLPVRRPP
jgi:hypothetical protein